MYFDLNTLGYLATQTLCGEVMLSEGSIVTGANSTSKDLQSNGMLSGFLMDNSSELYFIIVKGE